MGAPGPPRHRLEPLLHGPFAACPAGARARRGPGAVAVGKVERSPGPLLRPGGIRPITAVIRLAGSEPMVAGIGERGGCALVDVDALGAGAIHLRAAGDKLCLQPVAVLAVEAAPQPG